MLKEHSKIFLSMLFFANFTIAMDTETHRSDAAHIKPNKEKEFEQLWRAVKERDREQFQKTITLNPDLVNHEDQYGCSPLDFATSIGSLAFAEDLVKAGAAIDARNNHKATPLHTAAFFNKACLVKFLLDSKADPKLTDKYKKTASLIAYEHGYNDIIDIFKEHAAAESKSHEATS